MALAEMTNETHSPVAAASSGRLLRKRVAKITGMSSFFASKNKKAQKKAQKADDEPAPTVSLTAATASSAEEPEITKEDSTAMAFEEATEASSEARGKEQYAAASVDMDAAAAEEQDESAAVNMYADDMVVEPASDDSIAGAINGQGPTGTVEAKAESATEAVKEGMEEGADAMVEEAEVQVKFQQKLVTFAQVEEMSYEQKKELADRSHGFTEAGTDLEEEVAEPTGAIDVAQRMLWALGSDVDLKEGSGEEPLAD